jgi:hypothetical protein
MQEDIDDDGPLVRPSIFYWFYMYNLIGPQSLDSWQRPEDVFSSPDQLAEELATLTLLPRSRWQTLLKLEVIQVCNKHLFIPVEST